MTLGLLLILLLVGALLSLLITKAPFIEAPYKTYMLYAVWAFILIYIVGVMLGGWGQVTGIRVGRGT